ncbi:MAG: uroporphyrinogen-III C-methyltransferase, partial [Gemmatimonadaceae bacterium]
MSEGKVFFVGAGPGEPDLITVKGKRLIESADAVVYDALANSALLPPGARETGRPELYYVGKRGGAKDSVSQQEINELLVRLAREGKRVVRLKGGDPFVFGRGSEEAQAMNDSSVPFELVPGITAGIAAPMYA